MKNRELGNQETGTVLSFGPSFCGPFLQQISPGQRRAPEVHTPAEAANNCAQYATLYKYGELVFNNCSCKKYGSRFKVYGRIEKSEVRGCSNI